MLCSLLAQALKWSSPIWLQAACSQGDQVVGIVMMASLGRSTQDAA